MDSIELGDDFVEEITRAVGACDVLLALVGDHWLAATDAQGGRRLDDPKDFVRLEIEAALSRRVRVVPILVDGAHLPRAEELPSTLAPLVRRQALELSPARFDSDMARLLRVLDRTLAEVATGGAGGAGSGPGPSTVSGATATTRWVPVAVAAAVVAVLVVVVLVVTRSGQSPSADGDPTAGTGTGAAATGGTSAGVVFADDFSDPGSGWTVTHDPGTHASGRYTGGVYRVDLVTGAAGGGVAALLPPGVATRVPRDVELAVTAHRLAGSAQGVHFGLLCRLDAEAGTAYYFEVSEGYRAIIRADGSAFVPLQEDAGTPLDAAADHRLRASCVQNGEQRIHLTFSVDDLPPLRATDNGDTVFRSGGIGLFLGTVDAAKEGVQNKPAAVAFDDFGVAREGGSG